MLDAPNMRGYLARYRRVLADVPAVWGLHNDFDTTYGGSAGLRTMIRAVEGRIWLTETGGIVTNRCSSGRIGLRYDEDRAARGVRRAIAMADARRRRVTRVYLYQWRGGHDALRRGTPRARRHAASRLSGAAPRGAAPGPGATAQRASVKRGGGAGSPLGTSRHRRSTQSLSGD